MKIRLALGVALAMATMTGCQGEPASQTTSAPATATPDKAERPTSGKAAKAKPFSQAMPEGVTLDFPYSARSIKLGKFIENNENSLDFRLEYLDLNAKAAADAVSKDLIRAGFTKSDTNKKKKGYDLSFTKEGYGIVRVYIRKVSQKKLRHADAKGHMKISFPAPPTPQPAA